MPVFRFNTSLKLGEVIKLVNLYSEHNVLYSVI